MELKYIRKDGAVITRVMTADEERSIPSKAKTIKLKIIVSRFQI